MLKKKKHDIQDEMECFSIFKSGQQTHGRKVAPAGPRIRRIHSHSLQFCEVGVVVFQIKGFLV